MDRRIYSNPFVHDQDDSEPVPEHGPDSPSSGDDTKMSGAPSLKKRKSVQKRVVSVPVGDVDGSKNKGETYPPSDSWAWRKYGQKPIKGSPYPRGYYRCSSSKGCPARKQVERSRVDPTVLVITYAAEHNHPIPTAKHHHQNQNQNQFSSVPANTTENCGTVTTTTTDTSSIPAKLTPEGGEEEQQQLITVFGDEGGYEFGWFADDMASTNVVLESPPICAGNSSSCTTDSDDLAAMVFEMREEDESLFADLGELPEFSLVFRTRVIEPEEQEKNRTCSLSAVVPCCGSTG